MEKTTGKSFITGALVLSIAGILAKCLGALYRIPFARIATDDCIAIYGLVYPVYNLLLALSTAGIPLAISKLVAEYEENKKSGTSIRLLKIALFLLSAIGVIVAVGIFINADWLAENVLHESRAAWSLRAIAPAMLFSCMQAVFRGYFQGLQQMIPTALSQITEQFVRVAVIFLALFMLMPYGDAVTAAGASAGASVGGCIALGLMLVIFARFGHKTKQNLRDDDATLGNGTLLSKVVALAIPIAIGSLILPIMQSIDSVMVLPRLEAGGVSHKDAMVLYGYLSVCVIPILNLPIILTTAISASLVPNISEALAMGRKELLNQSFRTAMQLAVLIVLPATFGLMVLAEPIMTLLYNKPAAGSAMLWSAAIILVVGLYQISSATLQGMGKAMLPMYSLMMGAVIKIALNYLLTPIMDVRGAALASVIGFGVAVFHNVFQVSRRIGWDWLHLQYHIVKPILSVAAMGIVVKVVYVGLHLLLRSNGIATLGAICVGGVVYFAVLLAIGGVSMEVIRKMPKFGPKLARVLEKFHLAK